ncbi:MAG: zinc ribbon domain-containing protein [Bacillota bacterium]
MSELIRFTRNYNDMSSDQGHQFEFYCDHCGNGVMSPFKPSLGAKAEGLLRGIGRLAGGSVIGRVGDAAYEIRRQTRGKAWDDAFRWAVEAVKPHFIQCSRCGKWVCREVCWNTGRGLCVECAPKLEQELAASQSEAQLDQMRQKVWQTDFSRDLNVVDHVVAKCPSCGAETSGGRFCAQCGAQLTTERTCERCGTKMAAGAKFCPECGQPQGK